MKKITTVTALLATSLSFSQKANTSSAAIAFNKYWSLKNANADLKKQAEELNDARVFIDKSYVHETTKNDPKTLFYYGKIYVEIPFCASSSGDETLKAVDAEEATKKGMAALKRSKELDKKERYTDDVNQYCDYRRQQFSKSGVDLYEKKEWEEATRQLLLAGAFGEILGIADSMHFFYGGLAAFNKEMWSTAEGAFNKTVQWGYQPNASIYYLSQSLQEQKKEAAAEDMLRKQVKKYPGNKEILVELINLYIDTDRKSEAIEALNETIALDPDNVRLIYTAGTIYENIEDFENAEKHYQKALELDPKDTEVLSAMGGLYFNKGADINNAANGLPLGDPNYDKMIEQSKSYFKQSVPLLEKAADASPEDINILIALRDAYGKVGNEEKFTEIKAKIAGLKKQ